MDGMVTDVTVVHSMARCEVMRERLRLETLIARHGVEQAKQWAAKTAAIYRLCIGDPNHYASQPDWKPHFEESIQEFNHFVATGKIS